MGVRRFDILQVSPVTKYTPQTPYTYDGDRMPLDSLDNRANWFTNSYSKGGILLQGWCTPIPISSAFGLFSYTLKQFNSTDWTNTDLYEVLDVTLLPDGASFVDPPPGAESTDHFLNENQIVTLNVPVNGYLSYLVGTTVEYSFQTAFSTSVDVPADPLTTDWFYWGDVYGEKDEGGGHTTHVLGCTRHDITEVRKGDVIYYIYDDGDPGGATSVQKPVLFESGEGNFPYHSALKDYDGKVIALGFVQAVDLVGKTITIFFHQLTGYGPGIFAKLSGNPLSHDSLLDIARQDSTDINDWIYDYEVEDDVVGEPSPVHPGYANKIIFAPAASILPADLTTISVGDLVELAGETSTASRYYRKSTASRHGMLVGVLAEIRLDDLGNALGWYIHHSGIWSSKQEGEGGTLGGYGVPISGSNSITPGFELWDNGNQTAGSVTDYRPTSLLNDIRSSRLGIKIDKDHVLVAIDQTIDEAIDDVTKAINIDTSLIANADTQVVPAWIRNDLNAMFGPAWLFNVATQRDYKKTVAGNSIEIKPIGQTRIYNGTTSTFAYSEADAYAREYWFSLAEFVRRRTPWVDNVDYVPLDVGHAGNANSIWHLLTPGSADEITSIQYDYTNRTLTITGTGSLRPLLGYNMGQKDVASTSTETYDSVTNSGKPPESELRVSSDLTPKYRVGMPWVGAMALCHAIYSEDLTKEKMMLFSYHGYSGYGSNVLIFYDVELFKKPIVNENDEWVFSAGGWTGSLPGFTPVEYYSEDRASYLQYKKDFLPNWTPTDTGIWEDATSTGWYLKTLPTGGLRLRILGRGIFKYIVPRTNLVSMEDNRYETQAQVKSPFGKSLAAVKGFRTLNPTIGSSSVTYRADEFGSLPIADPYKAANSGPGGTNTTLVLEDIDANNYTETDGGVTRNLGYLFDPVTGTRNVKQNQEEALPYNVANNLITIFRNTGGTFDLTEPSILNDRITDQPSGGSTDPSYIKRAAEVIEYPKDLYQENLIGTLSIPLTNPSGEFEPNYNVYNAPSIVWMSPKEIWIDHSSVLDKTCLSFIGISVEPYLSDSSEVDSEELLKDSMLEVTIAQSSYNDPEDPNFSLDNLVIGNTEYPDVLEGDSVRMKITLRNIGPPRDKIPVRSIYQPGHWTP